MLLTVQTPDIRLLKVFATIVEAGSFARAQLDLNVAQSTISTQMADLEKRLGMRLCHRGRGGFAVTDDGMAVYEAATQLFTSIEEFTTRVNSRRHGLFGTLRIATADGLYANPDACIQQAISRFRHIAKGVAIELLTLDPLAIEHGLLDGQLHVGIHFFRSHAPGLSYFPAFTEQQTIHCGRDHPLFEVADEIIDRDAVAGYEFPKTTYFGNSSDLPGSGTLRRNATVNMLDGLMMLVQSAEYISYLPTHWAKIYVDAGVLRSIAADVASYELPFELVIKSEERDDLRVDAFLDCYRRAKGTESPN